MRKKLSPAKPMGTTSVDQPFDLAKIQYEANYRAKRRTAFRWTIAGTAGLLLIAWWFLQPSLLTGHAIGNYKQQHYIQSRDWLTPLTWTSPQQFVIAFNSGTVDTQLQHYDLAQHELFRALALAPTSKRCMVVQNLVYSLNAHSSSLKVQNDINDATIYATQATSYITNYPQCFHGAGTNKQQGAGGGGGGGGSSEAAQQQSTTPSPSSSEQQQLQQKEQQGQQRQLQDINQDTFDPNDPHLKQW